LVTIVVVVCFVVVIVIVCCCAAVIADNTNAESIGRFDVDFDVDDESNHQKIVHLLQEFAVKHDRHYTDEEYPTRLEAFKRSLGIIKKANAEIPSATFGLTHFSDWTPEEQRNLNGAIPPAEKPSLQTPNPEPRAIPDNWAWCSNTDSGICPQIRNQGYCGSCWSYATANSLGAQYAHVTGKSPYTVSTQAIIDCYYMPSYIMGCCGGLSETVFRFAKKNFYTESSVPYQESYTECEAWSVGSCPTSSPISDLSVVGYKQWTGSGDGLRTVLYNEGPMAATMEVVDSFYYYIGGVFDSPYCASNVVGPINHEIMLTGYGYDTDSGKWFLWIHNSWGTTWGLNGYCKMSLTNPCAIGVATSYGVLTKPVISQGPSAECAVGCTESMLGGTCDIACNVNSCNNDAQACYCNPGCPEYLIYDGVCNTACRVPACYNDGDDCNGIPYPSSSSLHNHHHHHHLPLFQLVAPPVVPQHVL